MTQEIKHDPINHPAHYAGIAAGIECIDITRHLPYALGCAVKYLWRAGKKDPAKKLEDIEKALWYIEEYLDHRVAAGHIRPAAAAVFALLPIQDIAEDLNGCRWSIIGSIIRGDFMLAKTSLVAWIREEKGIAVAAGDAAGAIVRRVAGEVKP